MKLLILVCNLCNKTLTFQENEKAYLGFPELCPCPNCGGFSWNLKIRKAEGGKDETSNSVSGASNSIVGVSVAQGRH